MSARRAHRRRAPSRRVDGTIHFATWRLERGTPDLDGGERDIVLAALRHFNAARCILYACVVMNDHVQVLVEPTDRAQLEDLAHGWRSFTTSQLRRRGRRGRVWQPRHRDRIIRDEHEFAAVFRFISRTPFTRWPGIESYPWMWIARSD